MKLRLLDFLVCPIDKTPLELVAWESAPVKITTEQLRRSERLGINPDLFSTEILTGVLLNRGRKIFYPIHGGIPRLLVFPTGVARDFLKHHAARIDSELGGFCLPNERPAPGEEDILRSFSKEWVSYDWNSRAYWNVSPEQMYRCMRFLLDLDRHPVKHKVILEVGIGIGGIADYVASSEESEVFGVDLGYAVDAAYKTFGRNPLLHIIQASVFALPFRENTFDFVYSQGVIMCTYSTKAAFDKLAKLPKTGGRLYIWVYSPYDEERTLKRRLLMKAENIVRPVVWRLPETLQTVALMPFVPLYILHQNVWVAPTGEGYARYGWREAMHAARDRFTPRYVYRHSDDEVCGWFRAAGYTEIQCVSKRRVPDFVPIEFVTAAAVDGVRQ